MANYIIAPHESGLISAESREHQESKRHANVSRLHRVLRVPAPRQTIKPWLPHSNKPSRHSTNPDESSFLLRIQHFQKMRPYSSGRFFRAVAKRGFRSVSDHTKRLKQEITIYGHSE